jgi:S-adenosylmethionine-diacylglycerol 3-amino-3-carboxypropyl transferase
MDWLSHRYFHLLESEWQAILQRASSDARLIWRSGGLRTDFLDRVMLTVRGARTPLNDLLFLHSDLACRLHALDRVHTYGSFYIADLRT